MKMETWRKAIAILIISLFFAGTVQIGLSISVNKTEPTSQATEKQTSFDPLAEGWTYQKQITIDHTKVASDLTDFPIFISIIDSDLQDKAQTDGDDILFMGYNGIQQQLNHEIEQYDGITGELFAWVNIPSISSTVDTVFYMYYGNSECSSQQHVEDTWNSNFKAVWHLQKNPTQTIQDSTRYENDGTASGSMSSSDLVYGKVGKCLEFDGVDDYISVPDSSSLEPTDLTLIAWYQPNEEYPLNGDFIGKQCHDYWGNAAGKTYSFGINDIDNYIRGGFEKSNNQQVDYVGNNPITIDTWSYLALTFDKSTQEGICYVNGVLNGVKNPCDSSVLWYHDPWDFTMGGCRFGTGSSHVINRFYSCGLDEIRVLNTPLSAEWISTEFNNQNDPSSFYTIGTEEMQQPPATPQNPSGPTLGQVGIEYTYETITTDPEGDLVYYEWNWGDGTVSDWLGPFGSGVVVSASHTWSSSGDYQITVKAKDIFDMESSWSESLTIIINMPPETPEKPSGTILGQVGVEYTYATITTDPEGDMVYYKWNWGDGTVSDWLGPFGSGVVVSASHTWSSSGDYQITVKAKDLNWESDWSEPLTILMNTPPATPQKPSGTINGDVGTEYTYTTTTSDPDSDTLYYMWSWGDGNLSGWYGPFDSDVVASASHVWTEKGTYEIKVKAKDEHGAESDWVSMDVKMPTSLGVTNPFMHWLFEHFLHAFPILRHLLGV
jgi:flagellar hook protein FlgE